VYRFKINLTLVVEADSAADALKIASLVVPDRVPAETVRLTVQGELYGIAARDASPRHRKGVRRPEKARAVSVDDDYAVRRTR
jgi:hypothetical protein